MVLSESLTGTQLCCLISYAEGKRRKASRDPNKSAANDKTDLIFHFGIGEEHIFRLKMEMGTLIH